jgi:putative transposase
MEYPGLLLKVVDGRKQAAYSEGEIQKLFNQEHATMDSSMTEALQFSKFAVTDVLTGIIRESAQKILAEAVRLEADQWLAERSHILDGQGRRLVVANGHLPERKVLTGVGPVAVRQPRVNDRRPADQRERFERRILPPYLRRTQSVEEAIPWMYLYGISTNDMAEPLEALLGPAAAGISASTVTRLVASWQKEYEQWNCRSLAGKKYAYVWADGIYFNIRMGDDRTCILVLLGATAEGRKEIIAIADGYRESQQSWQALLLDAKSRGLVDAPQLAIGDGALGFWAALDEVFPTTRHQRCWVHKTANVLNKLPKAMQDQARDKLHQIWMAPTRAEARKAFALFVETYHAKYPKAAECLEKDRDALLAFYDFPAEHWAHLRTTNPIESMFATVRLRHDKTRHNASRKACLAMVHKLADAASRRFHKLNGFELVPDVIAGTIFTDGVKSAAA